jgi:hypothetical protein
MKSRELDVMIEAALVSIYKAVPGLPQPPVRSSIIYKFHKIVTELLKVISDGIFRSVTVGPQ